MWASYHGCTPQPLKLAAHVWQAEREQILVVAPFKWAHLLFLCQRTLFCAKWISKSKVHVWFTDSSALHCSFWEPLLGARRKLAGVFWMYCLWDALDRHSQQFDTKRARIVMAMTSNTYPWSSTSLVGSTFWATQALHEHMATQENKKSNIIVGDCCAIIAQLTCSQKCCVDRFFTHEETGFPVSPVLTIQCWMAMLRLGTTKRTAHPTPEPNSNEPSHWLSACSRVRHHLHSSNLEKPRHRNKYDLPRQGSTAISFCSPISGQVHCVKVKWSAKWPVMRWFPWDCSFQMYPQTHPASWWACRMRYPWRPETLNGGF